jgi:hypothetical protein
MINVRKPAGPRIAVVRGAVEKMWRGAKFGVLDSPDF